VFKSNYALFQAQFVVQHHIKKNSKQLPLAAESAYIDGTLDSVMDNKKGIQQRIVQVM